MSETHLESTNPPQPCGLICKLLSTAALILVIYPLSFGPAYKLYRQGPSFPGRDALFEFTYDPLITLLNRSRYSYLDNFFWWYLGDVWKIPMIRN